MAKLFRAAAVVLAAAVMTACGEYSSKKGTGFKPQSQGAPYEVVVVADHNVWDGAPGDTVRSIFYRQYPMVNRQETMFDVLRVLPDGFKKLITRHPNVLVLNVGPEYDKAGIQLRYDVYAAPQIALVASAPDNASMTELLDTHRDEIVLLLEKAERERDLANAKNFGPKVVKELIKEKFGFDMDVTPGFTVRNDGTDFLWLSYEMPMSSQGVIIYTYPFSGVKDFTRENLLARRDEFVKNIPGPSDGSYMITNPELLEVAYKQIEGRSWAVMDGFWDVARDYMGGPFSNWSTLDAANQRVIAIDFYVYSPNPRLSQRNYKRQLEHFIYSVKFPETAAPQAVLIDN